MTINRPVSSLVSRCALFVSAFGAAVYWFALQLSVVDDATIKPKLFFDALSNRFKILQLADLHLGEDPFTDWGPAADVHTFRVIQELVRLESPDFIVLSGDQLTANNVDANATLYYDLLADAMMQGGDIIPYAMIFGNHDDADFEVGYSNGTIEKFPAKTSRRQLVLSDQRHRASLTRAGPVHVFGVSNYIVPVYSQNDAVKLQIVLLDSGGGSLEQEIVQSQMAWLQSQRNEGVDGVAFQHIPTTQFLFQNRSCQGWRAESSVAALRRDPEDEISYLLQEDKRLHFLSVGHDHGKSYCCPTEGGLSLCFGRHSGYGGYGERNWQKGGRVFELTLADNDDTIEWHTWVRLESGEIVDRYSPSNVEPESDETR